MTLRILHTADNHIGLSFNQYPEAARERLIAERFASLERLVATAKHTSSWSLAICSTKPPSPRPRSNGWGKSLGNSRASRSWSLLAITISARARTASSGNNSAPRRRAVACWPWPSGITDFESDEYRVRFHACPCPSKHGKDHTIGRVADEEKPAGMLHIGIAHGNVEGLGLDADQRYFNMAESDFRSAGFHTWLLGHIHVPAPAPGTTGKPLYFQAPFPRPPVRPNGPFNSLQRKANSYQPPSRPRPRKDMDETGHRKPVS